MKNIVIIGAGDLGREIVWLIEDINKRKPTYLILGFLDDDILKHKKNIYGYKVLGKVNDLGKLHEKMPISAVMAIQDGSIRRTIVENQENFSAWESIIHPSAVIASTSRVGIGSIVFPQVTVSVDSELGSFGLYYIHSTICNDCIIGNYVSIMSGVSVSEHVEIGDECFLSAGSTVYPHKKLGKKVKVGVESVVSKNYSDGSEVSKTSGGFVLFK